MCAGIAVLSCRRDIFFALSIRPTASSIHVPIRSHFSHVLLRVFRSENVRNHLNQKLIELT
jgi:hypothetical protein